MDRIARTRTSRTHGRLTRTLVAALGALVLVAQPAWADTTLETSTTLSTNVALPTSVNVGSNSFSIRLSAVGGNIPNGKSGIVNVVNAYTMSTSGTVTAGTSTTTIVFPQINFNSGCPSSGVIPQGCPGNPFVVSATLSVATGTPGNTAGTLTVVAIPGSDSGVTADLTPALGRVKLIVVNAPPTVGSISGATGVDEGSSGAYSVSAVDPDADALTYSWSVVSGNASPSGPANGSSVILAFGDGPSPVSLQVSVDDGHGHTVIQTVAITVNNVAPTATFNAPGAVNEGGTIGLSLTGASDPSSADTTAGFQYAFDCGAGFGAFSSASTATCPTNDNGTRTVGGKIRDKDGGVSTYSATVAINNVAPTAVFVATSPVNEGSDIGLSLSAPSDPSSVDTAAGFSYSFDCGDGAGFGSFGAATNVVCPTSDNGSRVVGGRIRDKDGGVTEYGATVSIDNVAPTATVGAPVSANEGDPIALSLTADSDPSSVDTTAGFTHAFDCGDGAGFGVYASPNTANCATDDNGSRTIGGSIRDKDGGTTSYTASVTIDNVAPTASFGAPGSIDEGHSIDLSLTGASDPSSVDSAAGFTYSFDCGDGGGFGAYAPGTTASCATSDDGVRTVRGRIRDKDGGVTEYSASVTVANVAPAATLTAPTSVTEGSDIGLSLAGASDPSTADTAAGFTYSFDCGSGFGLYTTDASAACPTDDNGSRTVGGRIRDKDGGVSTYTTTVEIDNVAPTATFNPPDSVNEGTAIALSLTSASDPSSVDTTAGFEYAFDCGTGFGAFGTTSTANCPTDDNGSRTVGSRIRDKDGGTTEYSATVTINNVAPTATFTATSPVNEGSDIALSMSAPSDPSSVDTTAGFEYAFDCGTGFGAFGTTSTANCPTDDNGSRTVGSRIRDKDGGTTEYSATVTINNVAPTATFTATSPVNEGSDIALSMSAPSDPSSVDTTAGFEYAFDCGTGFGAFGTTSTANCPTDDNGSRTVGSRIRDKDGGTTEYSATVTINNVAPTATFTATSPVNEGSDIALSMSAPSDPSSVDTTAGFEYAFDCGTGFGAFGTTSTANCPTDDNGSRTVGSRIRDKDGGTTEYSATVTINNVAPTATFTATSPVNEGSDIALSMSAPSDPSSVDTTAGFEYAFDCGTGFGADGAPTIASCPTDDSGNRTVGGRIQDKDGSSTAYSATVAINNVAPTATFAATSPVDEGSDIDLSLTGASDPSSTDTAAGFTYSFDCGSGFGVYSSSSTANCPTDDNGTRTVGGRIRDKDGGVNAYTTTVTINNVAPTATFNAPASVNEGTAIALSVTSASDPSSADTASGFTYSFDCGSGFGVYSSSSTANCPTTDNGTRTVAGRIRDKDGGVNTYSATVTVTSVAPTATFSPPGAVNEGVAISLSLTSPSDPSSADTAAGFSYAFDCGDGAGLGAYTSSASGSCPTTDNGTRTVGATIRDKDGGVTSYSANVTVNNVAPVIQGFAIAQPTGSACGSSAVSVSFGVVDPANETADPIVGVINWGDGNSAPITGRTIAVSHNYAPGVYSLSVSVNDGDGGTATAGAPANVSLLYTTSGILQPIDAAGTSTFKISSTIPTKVHVTDCAGASVGTAVLQVQLTKLGSAAAPVNEVVSSSAADNGDLMRYDGSGQQYIFNLSTKRSQFNAGNDLTAGRYRLQIVGATIATVVVEFNLRS